MISIIVYNPEAIRPEDIDKLVLDLFKAGHYTAVVKHHHKHAKPLYIEYAKSDKDTK